MGNVGSEATKVNASKYEIFVASVASEWLFLQDANLILSHPEVIEPYTNSSVSAYSGNPRNRLTGTILYTSDMWAASVIGWTALTTRTNGEFPLFTLIVRETDKSGTANTLTFTNGTKVESLSIAKSAEGAVKVSINFVITVDPVVS